MSEVKKGTIVKIIADEEEVYGSIENVEGGFYNIRIITIDTLRIGEKVKFHVKNLYEKNGTVVSIAETEISFEIQGGVKVKYNKEDIDKVSLL